MGDRAHESRHHSPDRSRPGANPRGGCAAATRSSRPPPVRRPVRAVRTRPPAPVRSLAMTPHPPEAPGAPGTNDERAQAGAASTAGEERAPAAARAPSITLRVAEARVEDLGHAIARLAPADLARLGARPGAIVKVSGRSVSVARTQPSGPGHEGVVQMDGTARSNCGAGLQEQVSVSLTESAVAVSVRLAGLWAGAAPAIIAPDRILADLDGV